MSRSIRHFLQTISAILLGIALFASGLSGVQAATWLGDQQAVPPGYLGRIDTDDKECWIITDGKFPANNFNSWPGCRGLNPDNTQFSSAVFSLSPTDAAAGSYPTDVYYPTHWTKDIYMGLATVTPIYRCSNENYSTQGACEGQGHTWSTGYADINGNWVIYGNTYDCNKYPTPAGETEVHYANPVTGELYYNNPAEQQVQCWAEKYYAEYPSGTFNAAAKGQTAYMNSVFVGYTQVRLLGRSAFVYRCTDPKYTTQSSCTNAGGNWVYDVSCPYTPATSGNRVAYQNPAYPHQTYGLYSNGDYECWEVSPVPGSVVHNAPQSKGAALTVNPDTPLTLQWSCQTRHLAEIGTCTYNYSNPSHCNAYYELAYSINPLFSGSSGSGQGFATGNQVAGKAQFNAPHQPGSYAYGLTCNGPKPATLQVTVTVGNNCSTPIEIAPGNPNAFILYSSATSKRLNAWGYSFCINNATTKDYLIPVKTKAELDTFIATAPYLKEGTFGVTIF